MTEKEFLTNLLAHMGVADCTIDVEEGDDRVQIVITVPEEDSGMLIGHRGETISALRSIVGLVFREKLGEKRLSIDVNGYKLRRAESLQQMAVKTAEEVIATGHPISLPPYLTAEERRVVHEALRDYNVDTKSDGEGRDRRLTVYPKTVNPKAADSNMIDPNVVDPKVIDPKTETAPTTNANSTEEDAAEGDIVES